MKKSKAIQGDDSVIDELIKSIEEDELIERNNKMIKDSKEFLGMNSKDKLEMFGNICITIVAVALLSMVAYGWHENTVEDNYAQLQTTERAKIKADSLKDMVDKGISPLVASCSYDMHPEACKFVTNKSVFLYDKNTKTN